MDKKKKSYAVIGCGRFGSSLALALSDYGQEVLCVDRNKEKVDELAQYVTYAVQADVGEEGSLEGIGLNNVDCAIIGVSRDFEAAVLAVATCKEMKIANIIAKAPSRRYGDILRKIGANQIIQPEEEMGRRVAADLINKNLINYINLSPDYSIEEIKVPDVWIGKSLNDLDVRKKYHVNIIAINNTDFVTINPQPSDSFREGDHLFILGRDEDIDVVEQLGHV